MHPHHKEAHASMEAKLRKLSGAHGTKDNPSGNETAPVNKDSGPHIKTKSKKAPIVDGYLPTKKNLGKYARGGRTKHKGTNVNVIVGHPGAAAPPPAMAGGPALPMPAPRPPMPAPAGMPPGMAGGLPPGALPPGMPPPGGPPMPLRKNGGRTFKRGGKVKGTNMDAGAVSGPGRLEKIANYGKKAHMRAKAV